MLAFGVLVALMLAGCGGDADVLAQRRAELAERGAGVMPFDPEATTHRFELTDTGLVQTVIADAHRFEGCRFALGVESRLASQP